MDSAAAMIHSENGNKRKAHPGDGDASDEEADGASDAGGSDASGAHDMETVETRATQTAPKKPRKSADGGVKKQRKAPQKKVVELCAHEADAIVSNAKEIRQLTPAEIFNVVMSGQLKVLSIDGKPHIVVVSDQSLNMQLFPGTSVKLDVSVRGLCPLAPAENATFEVDKQAVDKMLAPFRKASAAAVASVPAAASSSSAAAAAAVETQTMV